MLAFVVFLLLASDRAVPRGPQLDLAHSDEAKLKKEQDKLLASLDPKQLIGQHKQTVEDLRGGDMKKQIAALQALAKTGDPNALPLMLPLLESKDDYVRIWAGSSVSQLVADHVLKRRDLTIGDRGVLKPLGKNDRDLRALTYTVINLLKRADNGNTHAYAATMIRYLELREFATELNALRGSRHPAVFNQAKWALKELELIDDPTRQP